MDQKLILRLLRGGSQNCCSDSKPREIAKIQYVVFHMKKNESCAK